MLCNSSFGVRSPRPRFYQELDHCVYRFNVSPEQKTAIHPSIPLRCFVLCQTYNAIAL